MRCVSCKWSNTWGNIFESYTYNILGHVTSDEQVTSAMTSTGNPTISHAISEVKIGFVVNCEL